MKIRKTRNIAEEQIELQMTPMIDIVFQLLVFFIMSFKIVAQEGDFNVKMPLQGDSPTTPEIMPLAMKLRLTADDEGKLTGIALNDVPFTSFTDLHMHIRGLIGDESGPGSIRETAEIELDCDYQLAYTHVIEAVTAVSGYIQNDSVIKLIEKIKFAPPTSGFE
ncbi:MAG: biopolymer transporter ExbD [Planctomycetales bacterium]|nr:biopolymer transporter ExbD [Planctomycetales bacterium]